MKVRFSINSRTFSTVISLQSPKMQEISEGTASIKTRGSVFYNPVQEFNRDLSVSVISTYSRLAKIADIKSEGLSILEALSATGLRSIRYAKEVPNIKKIVANDLSQSAVEDIKCNVESNQVADLVFPSLEDAGLLMYKHRRSDQFDVIDLDPYGTPSIFLDPAVQAVKNGGLLLVTATDMAVLAGNSPETCHSKYGSLSLKIKSCHEMALRILLRCIESHANRYGKHIVPLLSISADFYIRVFVEVRTSARNCKYSIGKLSHVYHCPGCDSFKLQPLGAYKNSFSFPKKLPISSNCEHCDHSLRVGGPIWSDPIHDPKFVKEVLDSLNKDLKTSRRIEGVLSMILEELHDIPLYYVLDSLCGTVHVQTPPMTVFRSALLNANYRVSFSHARKNSIKTDAPTVFLWDIMRSWEKTNPASQKRLAENATATNILSKSVEHQVSFELHAKANPESREKKSLRFPENPVACWGPGFRGKAMVGEEKVSKSKRNQGKRKREESTETL